MISTKLTKYFIFPIKKRNSLTKVSHKNEMLAWIMLKINFSKKKRARNLIRMQEYRRIKSRDFTIFYATFK